MNCPIEGCDGGKMEEDKFGFWAKSRHCCTPVHVAEASTGPQPCRWLMRGYMGRLQRMQPPKAL